MTLRQQLRQMLFLSNMQSFVLGLYISPELGKLPCVQRSRAPAAHHTFHSNEMEVVNGRRSVYAKMAYTKWPASSNEEAMAASSCGRQSIAPLL
eukprot:4967683-Amphidinium_carterae.1